MASEAEARSERLRRWALWGFAGALPALFLIVAAAAWPAGGLYLLWTALGLGGLALSRLCLGLRVHAGSGEIEIKLRLLGGHRAWITALACGLALITLLALR